MLLPAHRGLIMPHGALRPSSVLSTVFWDSSYCNPLLTLSNGGLTINDTVAKNVIGVAIDCDNKRIWFRNPANGLGEWNDSATASPSGGVGYNSISTITGPYFAAWAGDNGGTGGPNKTTANFGGSPFAMPIPSGFSAWGPTDTWDNTNVGANITLSNGNLTATAGTSTWQSVRSVGSQSTGKYYFELSLDGIDTSHGFMVGVCNSSQSTTQYLGQTSANARGYQSTGSLWNTGGGSAWEYESQYDQSNTSTTINSVAVGPKWRLARATQGKTAGKWYWEITVDHYGAGSVLFGIGSDSVALVPYVGSSSDASGYGCQVTTNLTFWHSGSSTTADAPPGSTPFTLGVALDMDNLGWWVYNPSSGLWNGSGTADPASNAGSKTISAGLSGKTAYPMITLNQWANSNQITANFGASAFAYSVPSGFSTLV